MNLKQLSALTGVVLLLSVNALAQADKAKKLDEFMKPFAESSQFSGTVLASENGKVIYEKAFGLANADYKIPNQLNTRIGIASITKYMTSVILNRLIEENKIAPADKLNKYISDFPNGDKITIEMLARHRSGIPHRVMPPELESVAYTSAEFVEKVKQAKLLFEPGSSRMYSSAGYAVLARVLEIASGKPYAQLLKEYIFTPAAMTDSVDFDGETVMERRAQDYFLSPNGLVNVPLKNYSFLVGAGSVYSTARDIYRFAEAVMNGKYGEAAKTSLMSGEGPFNGSGSTNGHRAYFEMARDKKYGFVLVSNSAGAFDLVSQGVKEILEGKEPTVKAFTIPKAIANPKDLTEFLGHYKRNDGAEGDVVLKNGFLVVSEIKLYPTKPDCFFEYRFFGDVCFTRDASAKIKGIKWKGYNFDFTWVKQ